jgi:predicted RNase H-like nuclease
VLDACACAVSALRIARGEAQSFPSPPGRDAHGVPVAIWI